MTTPYIHPNTPPKLRAAFRAAKNLRGEGYKYHILADQIKVNIGYLHNLIRKGQEPTDRTEKGQAARVAMFLPKRKRQERKPRPANPMPNHIYWWKNVLTKEIRNRIIRHAWVELNGSKPWNTSKKTRKPGSLKLPATHRTSTRRSSSG